MRVRSKGTAVWAVMMCLSAVAVHGVEAAAPDYVTSVAPILKKYCAGCHNAEDREGKLSLESYEQLQRGGAKGPAILPGNAGSSRLMRLLTGVGKPVMPPKDNPRPTAAEVATLKNWISAGALGPRGSEPDRTRLLVPAIDPAAGVQRAVTAVDRSGDGKRLAVARFRNVVLSDARSGRTLRTLPKLPGKVNAVHFSADSRLLVTGSGIAGLYGRAGIWKVADGTLIREFVGHRDTLYAAVLSPDAKTLATGSYDRKIILWDAASGQRLSTLAGHNGAIYDLAFHPDGDVLASASGDKTVKLWKVDTGQRLDTLSQPLKEQYVVRFDPDGQRVLAAGADNRIRVWQLISRNEPAINPLLYARFAHEGAVTDLGFSADRRSLVSIGEDRRVKVWETERYTQVHAYPVLDDLPLALAMSTQIQQLLVGSVDGSLRGFTIPDHRPAPKGLQTPAPQATVETQAEPKPVAEQEPNQERPQALVVVPPVRVSGVIDVANKADGNASRRQDVDLIRFDSQAGQQWMIEVNAARRKSPLDSRIEVLDQDGRPVPRVLLRAVRDSYFTFRGKDSNTFNDFRIHNWKEMELNEYLYADGEVVKLWLYPRGPDSGFKVYPGRGKRYAYFDTTAMSHPLQSPCYIVEPHPPGTALVPNGLPVFTLFYENDDDGWRKWGADSRLQFTAPRDGAYFVKLTDVRGFQGADFKYELTVRQRAPDFRVKLNGANPTVNAGSGKEFHVVVERRDGFQGQVVVDITGLPPGFHATSPVVIESGQEIAFGVITAAADAPALTAANAKATQVTATAVINGKPRTHDVNNLGEIKLAAKPKVLVRMEPVGQPEAAAADDVRTPWELVIAPGQTVAARVRVDRNDFKGRISLGNDDAGRNLPHGVYVDNIGLNGLLIVEGKDERMFFITAAKWVPETTRLFHLMARVEGNQTSWPVLLKVRKPAEATP